MNFQLFTAKRYLLSKKKRNVINLISIISVVGVATVTMALVVILSVFNGFDGLVKSMFNYFDPDIKILPAKGKTFVPNTHFDKVKELETIALYSEVIQENVLLQYADKQHIGILKGVENHYNKLSGLDSAMVEGEFILEKEGHNHAVVGYGVAYYLSIGLVFQEPMTIWAPKIGGKISMNPDNDFIRKKIMPAGIFSANQEYDLNFVLTPIKFARELLSYEKRINYIEIKLKEHLTENEKLKAQKEIQEILGNSFVVKNRYQQQEFLNQIMNSEKIAIFLILSFILIVASFNIVGSITMLIIEKKDDISTLISLGASPSYVSKIFLWSGWLISISGAASGFVIGLLVLWAQIQFGIVTFPVNNFSVTAYPVEIQFMDFVWVLSVVLLIGFVASLIPAQRILKIQT